MSRESCIIVRPVADATFDERQLIELAIAMRKPPFDYTEDGGDITVYVDAPHSVERTEKAIMHALAESDVSDAVITPLVVGRRAEGDEGYTFHNWFEEPALAPEPAVPANEITCGVSLAPTSAFHWRALRAELTEQGRQEIGTSESHIEVGARDPSDADALIAALREKALIRDAVVKPLGRYRRWRVRQQLLGNYGGVSDPTQPS